MNTRFSSSTGTFYPFSLNYGDALPVDVIEVAQSDYEAAMARPAGSNFDFVNGQLIITAPPAPDLAQVKAAKLAELSAAFSQQMGVVKAGYPDEEIQSWFDQKSEAVAFTADSGAATPLLSAMAGARGIAVADLAARVMANAAQYAAAAGMFIGKRQKYEDAVNAALDADAVAGIVWTD